jgi:DNA-binding HxlR family transcriptional regulator
MKMIRMTHEEAFHQLTDILRCKWTLAILDRIATGSARPAELERGLDGLTPKVLHDRLAKLERYGLLGKQAFDEVPPRTMYSLTERGHKLTEVLADLRRVADDWSQS